LAFKKVSTLLLAVITSSLMACGGGGSSAQGSGLNDTNNPVITLKGSSTVTLASGNTYNEAGWSAVDSNDGTLTNKVISSGTVGESPGTYTITYTLQDSAGNSASAYRTVIVLEPDTDSSNGSAGGANTDPDAVSMIEGFGDALFEETTSTYTFPNGAENWAGFANMNREIYPLSFANGGMVTFTAALAAGSSDTPVYFRFERLPYPDVDPSYNSEWVTISSEAELEYSVTIPSQDSSNTYSSFLLYVIKRDSPVIIKNIVITDDAGKPDSNAGGSSSLGGDNTTGGGDATIKAIDSSKWHHQTIMPNGWSWFNNEQQHYTDRIENSYVNNGSLKIVAIKESYRDQGRTKEYTSARLNSKYAFKYGRVEVRAKLPRGVGTWPAIWTLGKNITERGAYWETQGFGTTSWPACGEIDIMEHWGDDENYVQSAMHTPSSHGGTINHGGQYINTATSQFHIYEMDWNSERIVFSVNGFEHYRYAPTVKNSSTWPYDAEQFLLLNVAIEDSISANFTQSAMEIDYVRVYAEGAGPSDQPVWADEFD
jgi:beta-glucanase (GH16 family)